MEMRKLLLAVVMAFASCLAQAQPAQPTSPVASPALWVVRDNDTTIYLFGSISVLDDRAWFSDEIRAAFESSTELALSFRPRLNYTTRERSQMDGAVRAAPRSARLSQRLSAQQNARLQPLLSAIGLAPETAEITDPWYIFRALSDLYARRSGWVPENAPGRWLAASALQRGLPITEIETFESQYAQLDEIPQNEQLSQLQAVLDDPGRISLAYAGLVAAWSAGDIDRVAEFDAESYPYTPALTAGRIDAFARWIRSRLGRPGTVFAIVPAHLLGGERNLRLRLDQHGLHAEHVRPGFARLQIATQNATSQAGAASQAGSSSPQQGAQRPAPAPPVAAGPRIALVIGVSTYGTLGNLTNPTNDARAMAAALRGLGFEVDMVLDPNQRAMKDAISRLGGRMGGARSGATGLFFFAGHGIQSRGLNYLIPAGAVIHREADLDLEAVSADTVLVQMQEAGVSTNIIILDACRNMPLLRSFRNGRHGLAQMEAPTGTFIAYSTAPGSVAADGGGANSPFSAALLREITQPGESIEVVFRNVRRSVLRETQGLQTPWDSSSLVEPFFFRPR